MKKKLTVLTLCTMLYALCVSVNAQPTKIPRIGYVDGAFPSTNAARIDAFRHGLLDVLGPKDIQTAFQAASKGRAEGVLVLSGPVINLQRKQIAELAAKNRLPAIYPFRIM